MTLRQHSMRFAILILLNAINLALCSIASAHEIRPAIATVMLHADSYQVELAVNLEALMAGVSPVHSDTAESPNANRYNTLRALSSDELRRSLDEFMPRLLDGVRIAFDDTRVTPAVTNVDIPPVGDLALSRTSRVYLQGRLPPDAQTFRWSYAAEFGSSVLRAKRTNDAELTAVWLDQGAVTEISLRGPIALASKAEIAWQYVVIGFTHILPKGLDHILFVLGLFLLSTRWRPLLVQVTAFTVAHSITLALSIYGVASLSPAIVEPLIAASIVYVAVENIFTSRLHAWRPLVVFGFGLLHGMGFAGVLQEIGLPRSAYLTGLVAFNVGVELGQLAVIALGYVVLGRLGKERSWYRTGVILPVSGLIATIGAYWTVERLLG
jgi:hydrogenase/urease accessory protein HupE